MSHITLRPAKSSMRSIPESEVVNSENMISVPAAMTRIGVGPTGT